jgi:V/A-type H+-transporting ATPase subunit A
LLATADQVQDLADLIGLTALPARQRMAILAGRLIREGLLQQSAVSDADAYSDAARSAALADALIAVADLCAALVDQGVSPDLVEEQDFSPLLRAREDAPTTRQVRAAADLILAKLGGLEHTGADPQNWAAR